MSSVVFRSSILVFLLLLFNGGSIALGALPYFYGPARAFQILQLAMAGAAFILAIVLPCFVIAKSGASVFAETIVYLLISLIDIVASVLITLRWINHNLQKDYKHVPKVPTIVIMIVSVSWAASLAGLIGFFLAMIDSCSKAIRKARDGRPPNQRRGSLPIQTPPRELRSAPYAQPHTTYNGRAGF